METTENINVYELLSIIQQNLHAPKNLQGNGVKYKYRSNELILQAVKPILSDYEGALVLQNDEIVMVGNRYYVKATTELKYKNESIVSTAYARESETSRTGMDLAQLTGSCSSYARKYSSSGLFAIDDNKDPDALADQKTVTPKRAEWNKKLTACTTEEDLKAVKAEFVEHFGVIFENLTGHPTKKSEIWKHLFTQHYNRVTGVPPVNANEAPDDLQKRFDTMVDTCQDWATYEFCDKMYQDNPALKVTKNIKALKDLEGDLINRLGER